MLTVILGVMLASYVTFAYRYARYSPWRATWQGVTLMAQKITLSALVSFFIVDSVLPYDTGWRVWALYPLLALLAVEAVATLAGLVHVQNTPGKVSERKGTGYVEPHEIAPTTDIVTIQYTGETREESHE